MPAVRRISRDAIVDAAVEVLRQGGFSAVNARSVAKKLGCSTQPIYSSFQNMDELKAALRARAIALHTQRVQDSLRAHEGNDTRYSSYGMGFVKFAAEEKQLFRCHKRVCCKCVLNQTITQKFARYSSTLSFVMSLKGT